MPNERFSQALSRIEAAADRLDARARAAGSAPAPADPALAERHARLRAGTAAALTRLDALIAAESQMPDAG